jgi:hypothetical protein
MVVTYVNYCPLSIQVIDLPLDRKGKKMGGSYSAQEE